MLSSHFDSTLPYAGSGGRRAVLLDPHQVHHRRYRPNVEVAPSCPRCDSPNTKFCYYNNYSLSQPRYFCKGCRRYWTKGGSLRNVPVGGGCRKNRRGKSSSSSAAAAVARASPASVVGAAAFSHRRFPAGGAVRPDILLEGSVVGGPSGGDLGATQTATVSAVDRPADGSAIDLALLYAKFLNRQPPTTTTTVENDQCDVVVVPDSVDTSSDTSLPNAADLPNSAVAPPDEPFFSSHDDGFGDLQTAALALRCPCPDDARAEPGFSVDQSCYESLAGLLATTDDGGDLVLPSTTTTMWHREAKYELFDSLPEDAVSAGAAADDVWGNALACQGLEAALCSRP